MPLAILAIARVRRGRRRQRPWQLQRRRQRPWQLQRRRQRPWQLQRRRRQRPWQLQRRRRQVRAGRTGAGGPGRGSTSTRGKRPRSTTPGWTLPGQMGFPNVSSAGDYFFCVRYGAGPWPMPSDPHTHLTLLRRLTATCRCCDGDSQSNHVCEPSQRFRCVGRGGCQGRIGSF